MSLELALEKNTAAIERLIVLLTNPPVIDIKLADEEPAPKAKRTKKEAAPAAPVGEPASEQPAPSPAPGATAASETEGAAAPTEPVKTLTYAEVSSATIGLIKVKGRDAAIAVLKSFGVTKADQIPEAKWPDYLAAIEAAR